jgi:hypothetical protein
MSSTYLTSDNMNLIERLLSEVRGSAPMRNLDRETAEARLLVGRVEQGTTNEIELRDALSRHVVRHKVMDSALARWDGEGGAMCHAS